MAPLQSGIDVRAVVGRSLMVNPRYFFNSGLTNHYSERSERFRKTKHTDWTHPLGPASHCMRWTHVHKSRNNSELKSNV
ncbi:hypothetical protein RB195_015929 [Necator americanus]|uniref:Uncharacterized protein n=1 Tax=Necator americanus TaxID=51031 RepID=A0ABR1E6U4_NECAM